MASFSGAEAIAEPGQPGGPLIVRSDVLRESDARICYCETLSDSVRPQCAGECLAFDGLDLMGEADMIQAWGVEGAGWGAMVARDSTPRRGSRPRPSHTSIGAAVNPAKCSSPSGCARTCGVDWRPHLSQLPFQSRYSPCTWPSLKVRPRRYAASRADAALFGSRSTEPPALPTWQGPRASADLAWLADRRTTAMDTHGPWSARLGSPGRGGRCCSLPC
jgi:hypothetical protein